ncbi:MAG: hypothetical protein BWK75_06240 [Candidatus Altiarchaeales archaeon A3]|nr:MAG: hypothetical protein BWK75_06240 [Candidatus Altiarchaeales archaeon A3]
MDFQITSCADVYVSTSLSDGLGISNIEALACGTPAVLADIDSTRNLIKKGACPFISSKGLKCTRKRNNCFN